MACYHQLLNELEEINEQIEELQDVIKSKKWQSNIWGPFILATVVSFFAGDNSPSAIVCGLIGGYLLIQHLKRSSELLNLNHRAEVIRATLGNSVSLSA